MTYRTPTAQDYIQPFDGSRYTPTTQAKLDKYRSAWNFYSEVQRLQLSLAARMAAGESLSFYRFRDYAERDKYELGMRLFAEAFRDDPQLGQVDWCDPLTGA
jgi:hypothetical protein